ncbi:MAG: recombinase family protein [Clostridia bacterium]|nr:recombinase family protein [Clostridia bacterium]
MRCAIYCRLSREDEDKYGGISESIINQREILTSYAAEKGWEIYKIYTDEDYSGTDKTRPAFLNMIADCRRGLFDIVLCKSQSRFARDIETCEKYIHGLFPLWNIRFVAVSDGIDTAVKGGKKARQITGLVNEWYLEDLSQSITAVLDSKRKNGQHIGSFALYGYKKDPENKGKLIIDPDAARVVRQIFEWCVLGYGKQHIAKMLNEAGVPNPTKYKQLCGFNYKNEGSGLWNKTTVGRILTNQMYLGNMVQGTRKKASYKTKKLLSVEKNRWIVVSSTHPSIIDTETFGLAAEKMMSRSRSQKSGIPHPLAGKVFCVDCKSVMTKSTGKNSAYSYLHCKRNSVDSSVCSRHSIRLDRLLDSLKTELEKLEQKYLNAAEKNRIIQGANKDKAALQLDFLIENTNRLIVQKKQALADLYTDRACGKITEEQYNDIFSCIAIQLDSLKKEQAENQKRFSAQKSDDRSVLSDISVLNDISLAAKVFIDRIEVSEKDIEGKTTVDIYWSF